VVISPVITAPIDITPVASVSPAPVEPAPVIDAAAPIDVPPVVDPVPVAVDPLPPVDPAPVIDAAAPIDVPPVVDPVPVAVDPLPPVDPAPVIDAAAPIDAPPVIDPVPVAVDPLPPADVTPISIVGTDGTDVLIGTAGVDAITGGLGADLMSGGLGADQFIFNAGDTDIHVLYEKGGDARYARIAIGQDSVTDFTTGFGSDSDTLYFAGAHTAQNVSDVDGIDSVRMWRDGAVISSHSIQDGMIQFHDQHPVTPDPLVPNTDATFGAAVDYLLQNDLGDAGTTVAFNALSGPTGLLHTYVYIQTGDGAGGDLIDLQGLSISSLDINADGVMHLLS
jgi:hypothetical protein